MFVEIILVKYSGEGGVKVIFVQILHQDFQIVHLMGGQKCTTI